MSIVGATFRRAEFSSHYAFLNYIGIIQYANVKVWQIILHERLSFLMLYSCGNGVFLITAYMHICLLVVEVCQLFSMHNTLLCALILKRNIFQNNKIHCIFTSK